MTTFTIEQAIKTLELTIEYLRREGNSIEREISICSLTNKIISYHEKVQSVPLDEEEVSELDEEENTSDDSPAKEVKIPKKRGRPPKKVVEEENTSDDSPAKEVKIPKKRGRPPKKVVEEENTSDDSPVEKVKIPKKRGRPPKKVVEDENTSDDSPVEEVKIPKKRGRPPKKVVEDENTSDDSPVEEVKIPKKRGRPPKKVVEDENTSDDSYVKEENTSDEQETDVEEKKPRKPRVLKEPIDLSSYGDLESLDWNRFVLNEGNHNKFWRGTLRVQEFEGTPVFRVLVHYGKIDSKGIFVQKTFESEDLSKKFMDNEIKSKNKKGYVRD